ncbi:MAG: hypothetical protein PHV11_09570, partial [Candidatus Bipolaricaulis sp.]|nr:hypothetical protein [Candidatus Bipolaricaulis sp.]
WYTINGQIPLANVIAAYQAKNAASYAASLVNLAHPGTYDATAGVAPAWAAATGGVGTGTEWLETGILPASGWSAFVQFDSATTGQRALFGQTGAVGAEFSLYYTFGPGATVRYASGGNVAAPPELLTGNLGMAGNSGYRNGVGEGLIPAWTNLATATINLLRRKGGGLAFIGQYWATVVYDITVTPAQALELAGVGGLMAAL